MAAVDAVGIPDVAGEMQLVGEAGRDVGVVQDVGRTQGLPVAARDVAADHHRSVALHRRRRALVVAAPADDRSAPARVRPVVDGVDLPGLGHDHVVGVAVAGRIDLHRVGDRLGGPADRHVDGGGDLGHVEAVVAAEHLADRAVRIAGPAEVPGGIVERGQVELVGLAFRVDAAVDRVERLEVEAQDRVVVGVLRRAGEIVARAAVVGVAADHHHEFDVVAVGVADDLDAVQRMVLLGARQAAHQVRRLPGAGGHAVGVENLHQLADDAGVGVEPAVGADRDARVGRPDVEDNRGVALRVRLARRRDAGDLAGGDARRLAAVVVVVLDRLDGADGLHRRDRVDRIAADLGLHDRVRFDQAVLLRNVQPAVVAELERRGVGYAGALQGERSEAKSHGQTPSTVWHGAQRAFAGARDGQLQLRR